MLHDSYDLADRLCRSDVLHGIHIEDMPEEAEQEAEDSLRPEGKLLQPSYNIVKCVQISPSRSKHKTEHNCRQELTIKFGNRISNFYTVIKRLTVLGNIVTPSALSPTCIDIRRPNPRFPLGQVGQAS